MNSYEEKQQARKARLEDAADKARGEAASRFATADKMFAAIPLGQPILVGHHSERGDRAYRGRAAAHMDKACEASNRADELAGRAASVGKGGVSSDDPDAVTKLLAQVEKCEKDQATYALINKFVRKGDREGLASALHYSPETITKLFESDAFGRVGIPSYVTTNNAANIRRLKARIEQLQSKAAQSEREPVEGPGYRIVEDRDINRLCIEFDDKPAESIRSELKSCGFRWSPNRAAWIRQLSNGAWAAAECATRTMRTT
ncbi:MAG: DUF3560 domain-containing protein [Brevundimonas sp.]